MRRAPGFAIAVALTLGVGIGVNGIVFGYVDSLLFRRVPARDADALVSMFTVDSEDEADRTKSRTRTTSTSATRVACSTVSPAWRAFR